MRTTVRAVRLHEFGLPQVMRLESVELPPPAAGEARVRHTAIGFNFIDVYQRRGTYPLPVGTGLGHEAAGVVEAIGAGVTDVAVGDRVAYMNAGLGAYAEGRNIPVDKLVKLPDAISDEQAAAVIFKGMTAQYLVRHTYAVKPGDTVLVHAAAGGVGQILSGWAKALGARVIGTAGSAAKCEIARAVGCDVAIDYSHGDWVKQVRDATDGRGVNVVYDAVGKDTFLGSLDCAQTFGMVVLYGGASGPAPAIEPELLNKKGCLYLTRPSVFPHNADATRFRANAKDLFDAIAAGHVKVQIGARFPLEDVARAHEAAEGRATTGAILLLP
ncbi:quinone oxidoreductase [Cupriavidus metallidurans]|uniref:quinone oxidoreductase family protein n=1 Tax=Cupriavidus TaxID=106589 RepID=UPI0002A3E673|nr:MULTISPECIES: quinone oxidoreductase [unclassified Cupriavidus]ELA00958.1 quinone oxidoreductase, NADPH-dependent [Cupriavidus sp. HMR-1]GMG92053.1 quinone oxidoreductase [Cupriavidus sp. TKC]HBO76973.1 quinone oxidoreductase [Cupriavidus sp.]